MYLFIYRPEGRKKSAIMLQVGKRTISRPRNNLASATRPLSSTDDAATYNAGGKAQSDPRQISQHRSVSSSDLL
jgi:hypothetical protein